MQDHNPEQIADERLAWAEPDFQVLHEIVAKARQNLNQNDWDYIVGATETETTLRRNRLALDSLAFRPRVLRDVSTLEAGATAFGRRLRLPVVLAPVGALESFHDGAAVSVASAARRFGVAHMLSSVCLPGLEKVAQAAPDGLRIFQLYVRGDEAWVDDHVARAIANTYAAFCITVDTAIYSRRERDIAKRHVVAGRRRATGREFQAALDWRAIERLKRKFDIPLVLKGIAAGADLVGLGRMQCYALAAGGEAALMRMLEILEDEVRRCLGLLGVTKFAELDASYLRSAPSVTAPNVLSAFPLLKIDDH